MMKDYFSQVFLLFDFEKITYKKRLTLHFSMWLFLSVLLFLSYRIAYQLTLVNSLLLTVRMAVVNMFVFYSFFYKVLPFVLNSNKIKALFILLISFPLSVFCWLAITHFISLLYYHLGFEILNGELKGAIKMSADQSFLEAVSPKRMLSQSIIIISILSPFFFLKILFEIFKLYNRNLKLQKNKLEVEIQNINIEKDFLKSQLNPHFLFNTLNNLYGLSVKKDDSAPEVILNLSEIMSYTLYESNSEKVALEKELDFIKNYFELEKMRYPKDKNIQLEILGGNQLNGLYIAPLLTFTFIENTFKYGLKHSKNQFIDQKIKIENKTFYFVLENDFDKSEIKKEFGGIGLENIKKRLQLLYPNQHDLKISTFENSFKVELKINL